LEIARRHHRAVLVDGKIFVVGGTTGFASSARVNEELSEYGDVDVDRFDLDVETPRRSGTPISTHASIEDTVEIVDLAIGEVTFGPVMPVGKALFGCVALQRKIYVTEVRNAAATASSRRTRPKCST
jgi:hypothetical protein